MTLRFLCDQCVPLEVSEILRGHGHEVILLRDVLSIRSPDTLVIGKAQELKAILISLNDDFSDIVTYTPNQYFGIISLQLHNHPEIIPQLMRRLVSYFATSPIQELYHGKLLIAETHRIRIRQ